MIRSVPRVKLSAPPRAGISRERLNQRLALLSDYRVGLIVAPAGSGKTTLLAEFAASTAMPVAWYRAEAGDGDEEMLLHALWRSLSPALAQLPAQPSSLEELVVALERWTGERAVLVVDDLHALAGTPAEELLERLVEYLPVSFRMLIASRCPPNFNLSRLRVSGALFELGADDLRFRAWEVERLFRDFYREPLPPEDLAELARRTEGWAAGLQLFHLATRGKPTKERRRILAELSSRSGMVREYLARNVLDELAADVRAFMVDTCVLERLTGPLCDELRGEPGSRDVLRELEAQQVFTVAIDGDAYRYHEALRSHLETILVEQAGEHEARTRYRRAAQLLERAGAVPEALRAYCRAEDWSSLGALLDQEARQLAAAQGSWVDALPASLRDHDPWVVLASARRELALGRLEAAVRAYERAEQAFTSGPGSGSGREICRRERHALALWLHAEPAVRGDWISLLRAATQGAPLTVAHDAAGLPGATGRFTEAVATLLAGHFGDAHRLLEGVADRPDVSPVLGVIARLLAGVAAVFYGASRPGTFPALADEAEALDIPWLMRLCRTVALLFAGDDPPVDRAAAGGGGGDEWESAVVAVITGVAGLWRGQPDPDPFEAAALAFRRLGAGVGEVWARCGLAVAVACEQHPDARQVALEADRAARSAGVPAAEALAMLALALTETDKRSEYLALATTIAQQSGLRWQLDALGVPPVHDPGVITPTGKGSSAMPNGNGNGRHRAVPLTLGCFGRFQLEIAGREFDCTALKPRPRAVLHLLAVHAGRPVHRERLVEALWPEADVAAGARNLHVAISTVRHFVEPEATRGGSLVLREGDAYRLALPDDAEVDLWTFEAKMSEARVARAAGDLRTAVAAYERALDRYAGELLPEDGPAEWVVMHRERYRIAASDAAQALTELYLELRDPEAAARAGERGLQIDPYRDAQWRLVITALERAGDRAAAARARRDYAAMLADLGLPPASN